jgi:hypothetical protein
LTDGSGVSLEVQAKIQMQIGVMKGVTAFLGRLQPAIVGTWKLAKRPMSWSG